MPNIYTNQLLVYVNGRTQKISADDTLVIGGPFTAASFSGDGSALTALDASNVSTGTLADARLSANVALYDAAAPTFTNTVSAAGFSGSGASLTGLDASNVSSGTLADGRLSANVPLLDAASNVFTGSITASSFNGPLGGDGSAITNLNASALASGTVPDARLSANVPLLDAASNTFTGSLSASSVSADGSGLTNLDGSAIASGTVADARLSGNVALYDAAAPTFTNTVSAAGFSGSGASLTSLNASELSSGTVADARLSANVPLKNAASNVFSGDLEVTGGISTSNGFYGDGASITNINAASVAFGELSDARLSSNIPRKDAASNSFSGSMSVGGDLVVSGDIISAGAQSVIIGDNFLDLNAGNTLTSPAEAGGLSVNVQAVGTAFTATEFVAGVAATSNPVITVSADPSGDFVTGDLIQVSGSTDSKNDGQYIVESVTPTTITVKGVGTAAVPPYVPFAHNQFVAQTGESATVTKANFSVLAVSNENLDSASGTIPLGRWAQAYGSNESAFFQTWIPVDPSAGATLQSAYNNGNAIQMVDGSSFSVAYAPGQTVGFSIIGSSSSEIVANGAQLDITSDVQVVISATGAGKIWLDGETYFPVGLTAAPTSGLDQYTIVATGPSDDVVAADAAAAGVVPFGTRRDDNYTYSFPGQLVRALGVSGSWSSGTTLYLAGGADAGKATDTPPASGRVYVLGVASSAFNSASDTFAEIRWAPQYVCDL